MIDKILDRMFDEEQDFYTYMELYEECTDQTIKALLRQTASEELQHYKRWYDIVFQSTANLTAMEKALYDHSTCIYKEMAEKLK